MNATGTIVVRTASDGTKIVGVRSGETVTWFPEATAHIVDAMKGHPGVTCVVENTEDVDPPVKHPVRVTVG